MTDKDILISDLNDISEILNNNGYGGWCETIRKAIVLLKEQEAVKPVPPEDESGLYRCGKCYHQLFRCVDKYCSRCGQAVKWNDDNQRD